jgi:hypothetical protein
MIRYSVTSRTIFQLNVLRCVSLRGWYAERTMVAKRMPWQYFSCHATSRTDIPQIVVPKVFAARPVGKTA